MASGAGGQVLASPGKGPGLISQRSAAAKAEALIRLAQSKPRAPLPSAPRPPKALRWATSFMSFHH